MKQIASLFKSFLKAAVFFTLFAFALNNQDDVTVHFFFGHQWTAPMVLVVLGTFACGLTIGMLGMVPRWWRQRQLAQPQPVPAPTPQRESAADAPPHGI